MIGVSAAALIYSKDDYVPFGLPYWLYYVAALAVRAFLLVAVWSVDSTIQSILLIVQILAYRLWNELYHQKYYALAIIALFSVSILNVIYMINSGSWFIAGFYFPYSIWCVALIVLSFFHKEEKEPVLPMVVPSAPPPKIRLNPLGRPTLPIRHI